VPYTLIVVYKYSWRKSLSQNPENSATVDLPPPPPPQTVYSLRPHSANLTHPAWSILRPNNLKKYSFYTNPCACLSCQPTTSAIQRYLGPQRPYEKPIRTNGNHDKTIHHCPYHAQMMATNLLHNYAQELKTFLSLCIIDIILISETRFTDKTHSNTQLCCLPLQPSKWDC
jgi:hypothetical protein